MARYFACIFSLRNSDKENNYFPNKSEKKHQKKNLAIGRYGFDVVALNT